MSDQWHLSRDQQRYGPYAWAELQGFARAGNIAAGDLIWSPTAGEWLPVDQVPGLLDEPHVAAEAEPAVTASRAGAIASADTPAPASSATSRRALKPGLLIALATLGLVALVGGVYALFLRDSGPSQGAAPGPAQAARLTPTPDAPTLGAFWQSSEMEAAIAAMDGADWREDPDLAVEQAAIGETLTSFQAAMKAGDLDAAVAQVAPEQQAAYRELFAANPDGMASFGELLAQAEMSFLSAQSATTVYSRTAEYAVALDGVTFYIVFIKTDEGWMLYDF